MDDQRMIEAAETGNINVLYELILADPYVLQRIDDVPFLHTPLHAAASAGRVDFMMEMMNLKPSFARKLNQAGFSPMHLALQIGRTQAVLRLLKFDQGGLVRVKGREGLTPLHVAVQTGNVDLMIKFLEVCPEAIEDVTVRDETVFHLAVKNDKLDAFQVLVGWVTRSLHDAAQRWEKEVLSWADIDGNTVLHVAAIRNKPQVVKVLLEHMRREHINAQNLEGLTALDIALFPSDERHDANNDGSIKDMLNKAKGLSSSSLPTKSISSIDIEALKKKMSCFQRFATIIGRGRKDIPDEMRNAFLVVTVLIITATYSATLSPPEEDKSTIDDYQIRYHTSLDSTGSNPATLPSPPPEYSMPVDLYLDPKNYRDVAGMFWLYNSLTFWVAIGLTAYLLPGRTISFFLLITLSLFGSCYMLLVTVSSSY